MRDYAKVSPAFWTRGSGRRLRGDVHAQLLGLYVVTCPNANMIGVYYLPLVTMVHETGLSESQVREALAVLEEADFAHFDEAADLVWVPNMASYQIGDALKEGDKRRGGPIRAEVDKLGRHRFVEDFWRRYGAGYGLGDCPFSIPNIEPEGAPKGHRLQSGRAGAGAGAGAGEDQEQEQEPIQSAPKGSPIERSKSDPKGTRIASDWKPSPETLEAFREQGVDAAACVAEFVDYWIAVPGAKGRKSDWDATFRNRVRQRIDLGTAPRWLGVADADDDPHEPEPPPTDEEKARIKQLLLDAENTIAARVHHA